MKNTLFHARSENGPLQWFFEETQNFLRFDKDFPCFIGCKHSPFNEEATVVLNDKMLLLLAIIYK